MAQAHVFLHLRTPQIKEAILQTDALRQLFVIHHERRRLRRIQHFHARGQHFDFTANQIAVHRTCRTFTHLALYANDEFIAQTVGHLEGLRAIRIADDLHQAFTITQVDENHATMIAATMHPAA